MKLIKNARIISPNVDIESANIIIDGEIIRSISTKEVNEDNFEQIIDAEGLMAVPGFIDIHTHGAMGCDVCDGSAESMDKIAKARLREGVTMFLPTTLTVAHETLVEAAKAVAEYRKTELWAETPGLHVEGPYINCAFKGAQNPDFIRKPDTNEIKILNDIVPVKIVTIAPEVDGALEFIADMKKMGIVTSAGHSGATYAEFKKAKDAGLTHLTHFFNQMSPLHHREIGLVGAGFADNDVKIEIICDKLHVIPDVIRIVFNTKSIDQLMLITDSLLAAGLPDGKYVMGGLEMFLSNNEARLASGALMGSTLPYPFGLKNVSEITKIPLKELIKATSWNQAKSLGLHNVGKIEKSYRANIALLDENFIVAGTMVKGQMKYEKDKS